MKSAFIACGAAIILSVPLDAETLTRNGAAGDPGISGSAPGQAGGSGSNGEGFNESVNSPDDAAKP